MSTIVKFALTVVGYLIGLYAFILLAAANWSLVVAISVVFLGSEIVNMLLKRNNKQEAVS